MDRITPEFKNWITTFFLNHISPSNVFTEINEKAVIECPSELMREFINNVPNCKSILEIFYQNNRLDYVSIFTEKIMNNLPSSLGMIINYINTFTYYLDFCRAETFSNRVWHEIPNFKIEIRLSSNYKKGNAKIKIGVSEMSKIMDFWMYMNYKYPNKITFKNKPAKFKGPLTQHYFPSAIHFIVKVGDISLLEKIYTFCEKFQILPLYYSAIWNTLNTEKIRTLINMRIYPDYKLISSNKRIKLQIIVNNIIIHNNKLIE